MKKMLSQRLNELLFTAVTSEGFVPDRSITPEHVINVSLRGSDEVLCDMYKVSLVGTAEPVYAARLVFYSQGRPWKAGFVFGRGTIHSWLLGETDIPLPLAA